MRKTLSAPSITSPINSLRQSIMKTAVTNVLIVLTLMISGGLLAMNRTKAPAQDAGAFPTAANQATGSTGSELASSVDWSKVKQAQATPTF
jgi:hypothetical protein